MPFDRYESIHRGEDSGRRRFVLRHSMGASRPRDLAMPLDVVPLFLHRRIIDALRACGASGWRATPATLVLPDGRRIENDYFALGITGRCGPIIDRMSTLAREKMPRRWSARLKGFFFDPTTWDGSDVFLPQGWLSILVTQNVRDAIVATATRQIEFTPIEDVLRRVPPGFRRKNRAGRLR